MPVENWSDCCSKCKFITSTKKGLETLCSTEGHVFKYTNSSLGLNKKCRFCVLMWTTANDFISSIHLFALLEPNTSDEINPTEHPFHGQKLAGFYVKPKIDPKAGPKGEEEMRSMLNIPSSVALLSNNLFDMNNCQSAQFSCYTLEGDGTAGILTTSPKTLKEERDFVSKQIIKKINACTKYHKKCAKPTGNFLPKRVIDLGPRHPEQKYCQNCYTQKLPVESLSKSIRDAINITGDLGFRYLWIDALCIIQDKNEDKMSQINLMGLIYRNAAATIAAANSGSAKDGFLRDWPMYEPCALPLLLPSGELGTIFVEKVQKLGSFTDDVPFAPLDLRGWTLQESLLSSRILHFGSHDLTWHCQTDILGGLFSTHTSFMSCSETKHARKNATSAVPDFPERLPPSVFQGLQIENKSELGHLTKVWVAIVGEYSKRGLTNEADRLPALAGLASEFQKSTGYGFVSGMWRHGLIRQLGWRSSYGSQSQYQADSTSLTPSWSWTTKSLGVDFDLIETEDAEILSCITKELPGQSSLTEIHECKLMILGKMIQASRVKRRTGIVFTMDYKGMAKGELDGNTLWLLLGYKNRGKSVGLVIQSLPNGNFVRLGQLTVPKSNKVWEHKDLKLQEITFV